MAIKNIDNLNLYFNRNVGSNTGDLYENPPYPIVALLDEDGSNILAAIKFSSIDDVWRVENVVAKNNYGPTIYKILMRFADKNGISTPPYEKNCLVVAQCKRIWEKFDLDKDVRTTHLNNGHVESYLNKKYYCDNPSLNIDRALDNYDNYIKRILSPSEPATKATLTLFQTLKESVKKLLNFKQCSQDSEEKPLTQQERAKVIEIELWANVGRFLDESTKPHRNH